MTPVITADRFADLYQAHYAEIFAFCRRRLGDPELAADLTQRAFLLAFEKSASYEERGTFRAWMYRIARNLMIDDSRTARPSDPLEKAVTIADSGRTPEQMVATAIDIETLQRAVAKLPEDQRTAFELRSAGLAHAEIARVLDRTEDAAKQLWRRAVLQLRREFGLEGSSHVR